MSKGHQPGTYRLMNTVRNRTPDRRKRYDWKAEVEWTEGTLFVVDIDMHGAFVIRQPGGFNYMYWSDERFNDIYTQLRVVLEGPSEFLKRDHSANLALGLLDKLHAKGHFTMDQLKAALKEYVDEICAEEKQ